MPDPYDSTLTEEQRKYIREKYPDVVGTQQTLARQMAMADTLRTPNPCGRRGWANEAACAIQGTAGGYMEGKRMQEHAALRGALKDFWANAPGRGGGQSSLPFAGANNEYGERQGFIAQQRAPAVPIGVTPFGYPRRAEDEFLPPGGGGFA